MTRGVDFLLLSVMVNGCCVVGCHKVAMKAGLRFFCFPLADKDRCVRWVAAVNRKNWAPKQHTCICNEHFTAGMYSSPCLLEEATCTEARGGGGGLSGLRFTRGINNYLKEKLRLHNST